MANDDTQIRGLIRLIPPARALRQNLEESLHMERCAGVGDPAVKLYRGLYESVSRLTDDPYAATLAPDIPENTTDEQKVSYIHLVAGQLVAFLEGQTGLVGMGGGERSAGASPKVMFNGPIANLASETLLKILGEGGETGEPEKATGE